MNHLHDLRGLLQREHLDALWISRPEHVRLLSRFSTPEDAKVLITRDRALLYTDERYAIQAAEESPLELHVARLPAALQHAAELIGGQRVGYEAAHVTVSTLKTLQDAWEAQLAPTEGLVEALRLHKDPEGVAAIREAQRIADEAYAEVRPSITPGRVELDVALDLEMAMRRRGAEAPAFDIIVASGPRGAMPHGRASRKVIQEGELVTIDMGARVNGWHSDMTRTFAVGRVDDRLRTMYDAVLQAELACVAAVTPGARAADLDTLARDMLATHGLAEYFTHSLGHGVGLHIHEGPSLNRTSDAILAPGMIVTIEPGVYVEGVGGVRIEDLLLVTEGGHEVLSHTPKERL